MPSFKLVVLAMATELAPIALGDYTIDPNSVPLATRQSWCTDETRTCPMICQQTQPGTTLVNTCDASTLTYGCICGNNQQPNVSEYTLTLPYYVCTEWGTQCVAACGQDNLCAAACRQDHPCGATDPVLANTTSTASATSTATASGEIFSGLATGSASPGAAPALELGRLSGMAVVLGSLFAGFFMLL